MSDIWPSKVTTLCEECCEEFEVPMEHNGSMQKSIQNIVDCPKCHTRNDIWIAINWPVKRHLNVDDIPSSLIRRIKLQFLEQMLNDVSLQGYWGGITADQYLKHVKRDIISK